MTKQEIMDVLYKARPCGDVNGFIADEHKKAVNKAVTLIKKSKDPYYMMLLGKRFLEGKSIKEIAFDMDCGKTTVHRMLNIAIGEILDATLKKGKAENGCRKDE